jgi:hypothetical protein
MEYPGFNVTTCRENDTFYAYAHIHFQEVGFAKSDISLEDALEKLAYCLVRRLKNISDALTGVV